MSDEADPTTEAEPEPKPEAKPDATAESKPPRPNATRTKWLIFIVVALLSLIADQGTKIWARETLPMHGSGTGEHAACIVPDDIVTGHCAGTAVPVIESFWHWRLSMNPGSAFGLFSGQTFARVLLSLVGIGAVFGMIWMLKKARDDQRILHWALALVAGGAVGNLIDRIYYGVVTDMVLWHVGDHDPKIDRWAHEWPVFNVADIVLVVGVGLMFIDIQKEGKREKLLRSKKLEAAGLVKNLRQ